MLTHALPAVATESLSVATIPTDTTWQVESRGGRPTLTRNGETVTPLFFYNRGYSVEVVSDGLTHLMTDAGVPLNVMDCPLNWGDPSHVKLAERVQAVLDINPDTYILLRLYLWAPRNWADRYPDEIVARSDGSLTGSPFAATSYASRVWRDQTLAKIDEALRFMHKQQIYDRVVSVIICAGGSGEWNLWPYRPFNDDAPAGATEVLDYSPAMKRHTQQWLKSKYQTIAALNQAYNSQYPSFDQVPLPDEKTVKGTSNKRWFRDINSAETLWVQDALQAYADAVADSMLEFAAHIRQITDGKRIIGTWYGQHKQAGYGGSWGLYKNGYLSEDRVINSDLIDLVMTPPMYITTYLGGTAAMQNFPSAWQTHGKFCLYEMDHPTHLLMERFPPEEWRHSDMRRTYWGREGKPYERRRLPANMQESLAVLRRAFGYCLIDGIGMQFWDMEGRVRDLPRGVFYDDPTIMQEFSHMNRVFESAMSRPRDSVAEIAVVYDPEAFRWTKPQTHDYFVDLVSRYPNVDSSQLESIGQCGTPFDVQYLQDWDTLRPYKLYVFLNAWTLDAARTAEIHRRLAAENATALWFYAPGYATDGGNNIAAIERITGFQVTEQDGAVLEMVPGSYASQLQMGNFNTRSSKEVNPRFVIEPQPDDRIWGVAKDNQAALAGLKTMPGGWTSIYSIAAPLTAETFAALARHAGCHMYTKPGYIVRANRSYLMIHGIGRGKMTVSLPHHSRAYDPYTDQPFDVEDNQIELENALPFTQLICLDTPLPADFASTQHETSHAGKGNGSPAVGMTH